MAKKRDENSIDPRLSSIDSPERNITDYEGNLLALKENLSNLGLRIDESSFPTAESIASQRYLDKRFAVKGFLEDFREVLGPVVGVIDAIHAKRDERQARRLADRSMREAPQLPSVRDRNRPIANLIREASIARSNPRSQVQPLADQINVAYNQDIQRAEELSGGQAGVAAGLGQQASINRDRGNLRVGQLASEAYGEGFDRLSGLVDTQARDEASRDALNQSRSRYLIDNNREDQIAAGTALAYTRARSLQARNNMYSNLLDSPVFDVDTYMDLTRQNLRNK